MRPLQDVDHFALDPWSMLLEAWLTQNVQSAAEDSRLRSALNCHHSVILHDRSDTPSCTWLLN